MDLSVVGGGDSSAQIKRPDHWLPMIISGIAPASSIPSASLNSYNPAGIPVLTSVSSGAYHTCIILGGALKCFGRNNYGQIGNPTITAVQYFTIPQTVVSSGVTAVGAGYYHTCFVVAGALKCFGNNSNGQLGDPSTGGVTSTPYTAIASGVTAVAGGNGHTCAIVSGALKCFGKNDSGQIGNGIASGADVTTPYTVIPAGVTDVAAGDSHTCAIVSGSLQCFGANNMGQIGNGVSGTVVTSPYTVIAAGVSKAGAGLFYSCVVVAGVPKCFDSNGSGQFGNGSSGGANVTTPTSSNIAGVTDISLGFYHFCSITNNNELYCNGENGVGKLGSGTDNSGRLEKTPVHIMGPYYHGGSYDYVGSQTFHSMAGGTGHSCVIQSGGSLICYGDNSKGQIGNGSGGVNVRVDAPYQVIASGVTKVFAGYTHTCAISSGALVCFGNNTFGQSGTGTGDFSVLTPTTIIASGVTDGFVGANHTCAMVSGSLQCFGIGYTGQLGNGIQNLTVATPYLLFSSGVTDVAAGISHTCAIVSGSLKCVGDNSYGQIGNNVQTKYYLSNDPYTVFSSGVSSVAAGDNHTCAVVSGALWCFGENGYGQIGNNTSGTFETTPVQVISSGVVRVFAAGLTTCAELSDHSLSCFGYGAEGIFNDGAMGATQTTPLPITLPSGVGTLVDFDLSITHACGIFDLAGVRKLYCWGGNNSANIFDDSIYSDPITSHLVTVASSPSKVSIGVKHFSFNPAGNTCFIDNGAVKCFGDNTNGQIDPTTAGVTAFVPITLWANGASLISAGGSYQTCALINDDVKCSGYNFNYAMNLGGSVSPNTYGSDVTILHSVGP